MGEPFRCQRWSTVNPRGRHPRAMRFLRRPASAGRSMLTVKEQPVDRVVKTAASPPGASRPIFTQNERVAPIIGCIRCRERHIR